MGLDSVELVMEFEKYFNIQISDAITEKIFTVQAAVDVMASFLNVTNETKELQAALLQKINDRLLEKELINQSLNQTELIADKIKTFDKPTWRIIEKETDLNIPTISFKKKNKSNLSTKMIDYVGLNVDYDLEKLTVANFIEAICAANYKTLIVPEKIKSEYEIYIAISGITVDKVGVDYYEIAPEKSFTRDLGVD